MVNIFDALAGVGKTLGVPEEYIAVVAEVKEQIQKEQQMVQRQQQLEQMNQASQIDANINKQ